MVVAERPLPGTPSKIPTIINKVIGGGKTRAEKEEKERKKREEKEGKERQRMEKERLKREERVKAKERKGRADQEQGQTTAGSSATLGRQSLFQRLFTRSKSMTEDDVNANASEVSGQSPPAVPKHRYVAMLHMMRRKYGWFSFYANGNACTLLACAKSVVYSFVVPFENNISSSSDPPLT